MDHIYKVHAEAKYTCQFCGKCFNTKQKLNRHSVVHSDYRPFVCVICDQKFKLRKTLSRHMMTHSGEKKSLCFRQTWAEAFSILEAEAKALTLFKLEAEAKALVTNSKPKLKPGY